MMRLISVAAGSVGLFGPRTRKSGIRVRVVERGPCRAAANEMGIVTGLWKAPGGTHSSMIATTLPKVLEFFADKVRR